MENSELIMLLIAAISPLATAVLVAVGTSSTKKALITALFCLAISLVANQQNHTLELVPIITAYLAAVGAAQSAWLIQKPADLLGKTTAAVAPEGIV